MEAHRRQLQQQQRRKAGVRSESVARALDGIERLEQIGQLDLVAAQLLGRGAKRGYHVGGAEGEAVEVHVVCAVEPRTRVREAREKATGCEEAARQPWWV